MSDDSHNQLYRKDIGTVISLSGDDRAIRACRVWCNSNLEKTVDWVPGEDGNNLYTMTRDGVEINYCFLNDEDAKAFEKYMNEIGQELGMTGPQVQANLWMGGAAKTGVDESSLGTFMQILRNRADKRAKEIGTTRSAVLQDFIKNKGLLAVPIAAGASGLLVNADRNEEM